MRHLNARWSCAKSVYHGRTSDPAPGPLRVRRAPEQTGAPRTPPGRSGPPPAPAETAAKQEPLVVPNQSEGPAAADACRRGQLVSYEVTILQVPRRQMPLSQASVSWRYTARTEAPGLVAPGVSGGTLPRIGLVQLIYLTSLT
jgi:hypothetical protein